MQNSKGIRVSFPKAVGVLLLILALLFFGCVFFKLPSQIVLFLCTLLVSGFAVTQGYCINELEKMAVDGIRSVAVAFIINLCIGMLISVWISAGSFSLLIRMAIQIIQPKFLLSETFVICCIVSALLGSSWITAGTVGLSIFYIAQGIEINQFLLIGAIVGGSRFGTCISPISDSANISRLLSDIDDIYLHIKSAMKVVLPAALLTAAVYFGVDFVSGGNRGSLSNTDLFLVLSDEFRVSILAVLPPLVLCLMICRKCSTITCLIGSITAGAIITVISQGKSFSQVADILFNGYGKYIISENTIIVSLLSRGGIVSMSNVIFTLIMGMSLSGILNSLGILNSIIERVNRVAHSPRRIVALSSLLSLLGYATTGDSQPAKVLVSNAFKESFEEEGLGVEILSRTLDISGFGEGIFPWTVGGVYFASLFGVAASKYWYFVFFYYFTILINIIFAGNTHHKSH